MDVYRQGKKVRLTQAEFKAQGGEGAVYVSGGTAYKVYADPAKMIPLLKIQELSALDSPDIVRPQDVLLDARKTPVGYTMPAVPDSLVLCQTFPKAFRERAGLTPDKVVPLVQLLQKGVAFVHSRGILIVDLNEMNFLVDPRFQHVYFIDVDSYQTPSFGATALMDSVRDRHAASWNEGTDWFSFAVVSFQMFLGIHPYKGKHPALKTLDERMAQNVSVFHPDVSLPGVCPPLSSLPAAYRDWYRAVLERGERGAPPLDPHAVWTLPLPARRQADGGQVSVHLWRKLAGAVVSFTQGVTVTTEGVYSGERRYADTDGNAKIGLTPSGHAVLASLEDGLVQLVDLAAQKPLPFTLTGEQLMATDGRLYVKSSGSLREVTFTEAAGQVWAAAKLVGTVLEQATQLFEGVALQNLVGAWYASLLPSAGRCCQVRLPELDGFQIVAARFQSGVLMVVAVRHGQYEKLIFRFSPDFALYDVRVVPNLATYGINFTVLDSGVCLHLSDGGELEIFSSRRGAAEIKTLTDPALSGDCLLLHDGLQALFAQGDSLFQMAMK